MIAIIGILAAILFPVYARAREKARQTSCLSNLKQLALSVIEYTSDWDESFPWIGAVDVDSGRGSVQWEGLVQPYIKNQQIYRCPSTEGPYSYIYNASLSGLTDANIGGPARTVSLRGSTESQDGGLVASALLGGCNCYTGLCHGAECAEANQMCLTVSCKVKKAHNGGGQLRLRGWAREMVQP